jgi:hypothetical protein
MNRPLLISRLPVLLTALALIPATAVAHSGRGAVPITITSIHQLPHAGTSAFATNVFTFGTKGGSLRPTTIKISLDGSISVNGLSGNASMSEATATLRGLMALAEAEGFFSMHATVGCLGAAGNPDVSAQYITIHTSTGSKKVQRYGACNSHFGQLYAVLQAVTASART